jgi:hypothetical protein
VPALNATASASIGEAHSDSAAGLLHAPSRQAVRFTELLDQAPSPETFGGVA